MAKTQILGGHHADLLGERLRSIHQRRALPQLAAYSGLLERAATLLSREPARIRPHDDSDRPGGVVELHKDIPTILIPDLHARMDFMLAVLFYMDNTGLTVLERLANRMLQIVCVGDGFHSEGRAAKRWAVALEEYGGGFADHGAMDEEMAESLGLMEMVMELKTAFPGVFHFLKGNHENVANELGEGNFPFRKFAKEGPMVKQYLEQFFGPSFVDTFALYEKNLPLLAVGRNFLVTHAEPKTYYPRERVIAYRGDGELVQGLTWTDNDAAEEGSVARMLEAYLGEQAARAFHFAGHRPVKGRYATRAGGRFVQIHNPAKFIIAWLPHEGNIVLERDIRELPRKVP